MNRAVHTRVDGRLKAKGSAEYLSWGMVNLSDQITLDPTYRTKRFHLLANVRVLLLHNHTLKLMVFNLSLISSSWLVTLVVPYLELVH